MPKVVGNPDHNGHYRPNLGFRVTATGKRSQPRLNLGKDKREAQRRLDRIMELWEHVKKQRPGRTVWDNFEWEICKSLAIGSTQIRIPRATEQNWHSYTVRINRLSHEYPMINFVVDDVEAYERGTAFNQQAIEHEVERAKERGLVAHGDPVPQLDCDGTLYQAFDDYRERLTQEHFDVEESHVSDYGKTRLRRINLFEQRFEDMPLAELDLAAIDKMILYFRGRPPKKHKPTPMAMKSCQHCITELKNFFDWLDLSKYNWPLPERFHRIKTRVRRLESDAYKNSAETPTYDIDQLNLLNEYATPIERLFLLLGLNCAYGADQAGRLQVGDVRFDEHPPCIDRIRVKKETRSCHRLWSQTLEGLKWAMSKHRSPQPSDVLILNGEGKPYWRKTKGGNRVREVAKLFKQLVQRVQVDHPDLPWHGFNAIRDTSINMVRQEYGEEMAMTHAAHKHQSPDKNLWRYSNPRVEELHRIHGELEIKLQSVFDAPSDPWARPRKSYTSNQTVKRIYRWDDKGLTPNQIAHKVGVSHMTVRRWLKKRAAETDEKVGAEG